jgi:hypothetical protein
MCKLSIVCQCANGIGLNTIRFPDFTFPDFLIYQLSHYFKLIEYVFGMWGIFEFFR